MADWAVSTLSPIHIIINANTFTFGNGLLNTFLRRVFNANYTDKCKVSHQV